LIAALVLSLPEEDKPYTLYTDPSKKGSGVVLMQDRKVVADISLKLKLHEFNYPTYDLELAAIMFPPKKWRHYLYKAEYKEFTDHKSLKYIHSEGPEYQAAEMDGILGGVPLPHNYHPRKANVVADKLSRKVRMAMLRVQEAQSLKEMLECEAKVQEEKISVSNLKLTPDLKQEISGAQKKDNDFQAFKSKILEKKDSDFWEGENGTLYFLWSNMHTR
jgi:hypothetical protein